MAHQSIWGPDPYERRSQGRARGLSPHGGKEFDPQEPREDDIQENVAGLGPTLAASRVEDSSTELALDLVLNDIAEQARVSTLATGAIIALRHGDELICRAVAGDTSVQLGMQLDTHSGLCGDCVETQEPQFSNDTEADTRVEAQASRLFGIRSMVALPIVDDGKKLLGILELSWPWPNAVREPEVQRLQSFCAVIVSKLEGATQAVVPPSTGDPLMTAASAKNLERVAEPAIKPLKSSFDPAASLEKDAPSEHEDDLWPWEIEAREKVKASQSRYPRRQETSTLQLTPVLKDTDGNGSGKRGHDYWTSILTAVVIALALLLGWMVGRAGWEMAVDKASERTPAMAPEAQVQEPPGASLSPAESPADVESNKPADVPSKKAKTKTRPDSDVPLAPADSTTTAAAVNSKASSQPVPHQVSAGGLIVYEKGKVVFKMPPSERSSQPANSSAAAQGSAEPDASDASAPLRVSSDAVNRYLLQRVEPEYPEPAKLQHIEGAVVLGILVGSDGTVKSLSVVSGDLQLVNAATDAVRQWRFKPYLLNGKAVEFETRVTVNFALP
jgi:TonB family protein